MLATHQLGEQLDVARNHDPKFGNGQVFAQRLQHRPAAFEQCIRIIDRQHEGVDLQVLRRLADILSQITLKRVGGGCFAQAFIHDVVRVVPLDAAMQLIVAHAIQQFQAVCKAAHRLFGGLELFIMRTMMLAVFAMMQDRVADAGDDRDNHVLL